MMSGKPMAPAWEPCSFDRRLTAAASICVLFPGAGPSAAGRFWKVKVLANNGWLRGISLHPCTSFSELYSY
jgi:hypothetical protein